MNACRDAIIFRLLREGSGPLPDLVQTHEARSESRHEHAGGDGLSRAQLFVQRSVGVRDP